MFTWPRPGIQIGSCMRSTPGATSVTSSDAVLLFLAGGGRGSRVEAATVTVSRVSGGYPVYAIGANLGHGRLVSATMPHASTSSSS